MPSTKLLIVEDDPKSRFALATVLQDKGFQVVACDSAESVSDLADPRFDAAILDVRLTGAPGTQIARHLQKANPAIRLVFMTAYDKVDSIATDFPGAKILVKPLDMEKLFHLL